jgi:hypothetical protein
MGVYLGDKGRVLISRTASQMSMYTTLNVDDVSVERQRLSIDGAALQLITGDRVRFKTQDGSDLQFAQTMGGDDDVIRWVNVDGMGGVRLYDSFSAAVKGGKSRSLQLDTPTAAQDITVRVMGEPDVERCLAEIRNFSITTSRENIDITCLNQHFRNNYENGLIAGQGSLNCFWSHETDCGSSAADSDVEFAEYLARLCIRVVQGASFAGYFYLYYGGEGSHAENSTWYECQDCIVTNVAVSVQPDQLITAEIQFVTSGPIVLRHGRPPSFLVQEEAEFGLFDLEQDVDSHIELENDDG